MWLQFAAGDVLYFIGWHQLVGRDEVDTAAGSYRSAWRHIKTPCVHCAAGTEFLYIYLDFKL